MFQYLSVKNQCFMDLVGIEAGTPIDIMKSSRLAELVNRFFSENIYY